MFRRLLLAALLAAAVAIPAGHADNPALTGTVGPGFSISLTDASGSPVTHLDPGAYTVVVHDLSGIHNFHLSGPGVSQLTDVEGTGDSTWAITVQDGATYTFVCDVHPSLKGTFTVGNVVAKPPAAAPKLLASVGPGASISLATEAGAAFRAIAAGSYTISGRDLSAKDNFHLRGPGLDRKTSVAGKGAFSWTVKLAAGVYTFGSDAHPALKGRFTVK